MTFELSPLVSNSGDGWPERDSKISCSMV